MMSVFLLLTLVVITTPGFVTLVSSEEMTSCVCCTPTTNLTSCPFNRTTLRPDCPCCPVCARQSGETCDQLSLPCDARMKLKCDNGICQGSSNLRAVNTTNNATKLEWQRGTWTSVLYGSSLNGDWKKKELPQDATSYIIDGLEPNSTYYISLESSSQGSTDNSSEIVFVTTKDACDVNGTWLAEGESITEGCEKRCTCGAGGKLECVPRCVHRPGSLSDPLCVETPHELDSCCVEYACAQTNDSGAPPHLIVTGRAPSNVSVAWDDFKPPSYERGYVLEVRVAGSEANRIQLQANNTNMMTIEDLIPNTTYEVRVAIWDDQDKLTSASEFINVTTTDGCVKNKRTYRMDEEWTEGCESRCICRQNNSVECSERCVWPLYRADASPSDPRCTAIPEKDTCCVSMRCQHDTDPSPAVTRCPTPSPTESDHCVSTCQSDNDCPALNEFCCPTSCGAKICINSSTNAVNETDVCLNVVCGPHSRCRLVSGAATCQCVEGAIGDPNDYTRGCTPGTAPSLTGGCSFNNKTYLPGENFYDGCEYRCLCNLNAEIECELRCAPPAVSLNDPTCHVITDPSDSCCNVTVCGSHPIKQSPKKVTVESLDGCFYRNKTYQRLEQIQEGCSMKCTCQGRGSISCVQRCPPTAPVGPGCVVLTDPIDSCCNVTICDITGVKKEMEMTTTADSNLETTVNVPENTIVPLISTTAESVANNTIQETTTIMTTSSNPIKKETEETLTVKDNYFPVPTKDAFNELGPTDAAKKGESTSKVIRTLNVTESSKLEETTTVVTTENSEINHLEKELTTTSDNPTTVDSSTSDNKVDVNSKENSKAEHVAEYTATTSDFMVTETTTTGFNASEAVTTPSLLLTNVRVEKKERGRKLEDKVTGLNNDVHCDFNGVQMVVGQELADGCRQTCKCLDGGKTFCTFIICPYMQPPQVSGCLDWRYDRDFQAKPGNCCAVATCATKIPTQTGASCEYNGRTFSNLEPIPSILVATCDLDCRCMNGNVSCESRCPPVPSEPPANMACFHHAAELLPLPHDKCCKGWQCPYTLTANHEEDFDSLQGSFLPTSGSQTPPTKDKLGPQNPFLVSAPQEEQSDVIFKGNHDLLSSSHPIDDPSLTGFTNVDNFPLNPAFPEKECETGEGPRAVGEQWEESPGCRSRRCVCVLLSNGSTTVECTGGCYPIERYLKPTAGCPLPVLETPDDPCFCPYVKCNKTDSGSSIQNLTAIALNSTTVRVNLVIPKLYVGLYGQVELLYTDDATQTNTSTWNKEVFSHRNDMFAEPRMQHDLNSLLPDTTYYVKADVILTGNSNTATSNVVTVRTPPLLISTTAATTLPSRITFDPVFNITDKQPTSIRLSWRALTDQEKRVVDGLQLKYRVQGDETWSLTTIIHRDVTSYVLRDLQPNTAYEVDMLLTPVDDVGTEIETFNSVTFETKPIHDDYAFDITLVVDKVFITSANLHWSGVPFPMHKYVHLYIIKYKMDSQVETQTIYKYPKVEQVTLEGLKPGNRYQIWMEAILSNGDVRKSNTLEFVTKPGVALKQPEKERLETSQSVSRATTEASTNNSYYEALIAVAVVAAICVLGFVALLVLLFRRQGSTSTNAPPSSPHKSQSAYENPTYKPSYEGELENGKTQA